MWRREWWCAALMVLAVGCSAQTRDGAADTTTSALPTTSISTTSPGTSATPGALVVGAGPEVMVSGGLLPVEVTTAITSKGGELADTASWDARYETFGLPRIAGPGVRLVAAEIEATAVDGGWQRRDALQWLFMDISHASLDELLDDLASAAGVGDWAVSEFQQTISNGKCVERTYTSSPSDARWKLSGCSYPDFAGLFALGVERSGRFTQAPSPVDPSVAALSAALGGHVTRVSVIFGHPTSTGSAVTLTAEATVTFEAGLADARAILEGGLLTGWSAAPGEGSVMYAGGIGTRWVVTSGEATLAATGRLVS